MIEPPVRLAAMRRAASWPTRNTPSRLTDITQRHSSSLVLVKKAPEGTPALLTRIVIGPSAASAPATALRHRGAVGDVHGQRGGLAAVRPDLGGELLAARRAAARQGRPWPRRPPARARNGARSRRRPRSPARPCPASESRSFAVMALALSVLCSHSHSGHLTHEGFVQHLRTDMCRPSARGRLIVRGCFRRRGWRRWRLTGRWGARSPGELGQALGDRRRQLGKIGRWPAVDLGGRRLSVIAPRRASRQRRWTRTLERHGPRRERWRSRLRWWRIVVRSGSGRRLLCAVCPRWCCRRGLRRGSWPQGCRRHRPQGDGGGLGRARR